MNSTKLLEIALQGMVSVEGPAGSGKTSAVTDLLLRLLVEHQYAVDEVGVLTPLSDAAETLQRQLTSRLNSLLTGGLDGDDPLARRWASRYADQQALLARLNLLRHHWSSLPVMGFGRFCAWVLEECGWMVGVTPGVHDVLGWERSLVTRVAVLWRQDCRELSPLLAEFLLDEGIDAITLTRQIRTFVGRDLQALTPRLDDLGELEGHYARCFTELRHSWWQGGREVLSRHWRRAGTDRSAGRVIQQSIAILDRWLSPEAASLGQVPPTLVRSDASEHPVQAAWVKLLAARESLLVGFRQWLAWYRGDLLRRCDELGRSRRARSILYSLEDRVLLLAEQLSGPCGERLAASIRRRLPALIWDDCQQGSRIQHEIIRHLYGGTGLPVILLGDVCSSSDRFGRADVFAYLEQCRRADLRVRLESSYHSRAGLGYMLDLLFQRPAQPFVVDLGGARPAAQQGGDAPALVVEGEEEPAVQFWWLGDDDGQPWKPGEAAEQAAQTCAGEIARLLNLAHQGQAWLGEEPLNANHIVVLVANLAQARRMHSALLRLGVPGVRLAQETVLHSREAEDLERVLLAVAEPWREERVMVALATDLLGLDGAALLALSEDAAQRREYLDAFRSYHELWRRHGFMRMFRSWLTEESVLRRLLQFRDGEQRLTNLLHLSELLQTIVVQAGLGPEALCRWMRQRRLDYSSNEFSQSRLSSDEPRVRVITAHLAQGLHFPLVFCPFIWDLGQAPAAVLFHEPEDSRRPRVDFGSAGLQRHQRLAARESLSLGLRTLYLMLTRATSRLYLSWGKIRAQGGTPPAWLLHPPPAAGGDLHDWVDYVESLSAEQLLDDLSSLVEVAGGALRIEYPPEDISSFIPPESNEGELAFRYFPGPVKGRWRSWRWRELVSLCADVGQPAVVIGDLPSLAPESLPRLLLASQARACPDVDALAAWLATRGWESQQLTDLAEPLYALLHQPRIHGQPLSTLLVAARPEVSVCASLALLTDPVAIDDSDRRLPRAGFLEDHIDWLLCLDGDYHAVCCCWEPWSAQAPASLHLGIWAALIQAVFRSALAEPLRGVHFLFPTGMQQDDPLSGYWQQEVCDDG